MKAALCKAFCDELDVRPVGAGLVVSTPFEGANGERLGFYIIRDGDDPTLFHLEDDGATIPLLEADGIDFGTDTRQAALTELLTEYRASYDVDLTTLVSASVSDEQVPAAALRFAAMLLRLRDFALLSPERVQNTFREDAARLIKAQIGSRAAVRENEAVSEDLADFPADLVIRATNRDPVAVFLGVSEQRISEAIMLQMAATYEARTPVQVIGVLERETALSGRGRQRAANRLAALTYFRGDEAATVQRIEREVFGLVGALGRG